MSPQRERTQLSTLAPPILAVATASVLFVAASVLLADARGEAANDLFADMYELTGSRLTGLISTVGVVLLAATSAVCLFTARIIWRLPKSTYCARFLLGAGLLTAVLATDDYLSVHEFADDMLTIATGVEAGRALKNILEAVVLGVYGLLFSVLLWRFRSTVASTEWALLAIAGALLLASLVLDMAPHSWLASNLGLSLDTQGFVEDTLKLTGIAFYVTYFVRTSARAVRPRSDDAGTSG
jgi:hypothetical protein